MTEGHQPAGSIALHYLWLRGEDHNSEHRISVATRSSPASMLPRNTFAASFHMAGESDGKHMAAMVSQFPMLPGETIALVGATKANTSTAIDGNMHAGKFAAVEEKMRKAAHHAQTQLIVRAPI